MIEAWARGAYLEVKSQMLHTGLASPETLAMASRMATPIAGGVNPRLMGDQTPPSPLLLAASLRAALAGMPQPLGSPLPPQPSPTEPFSIRRAVGDDGQWGSGGGAQSGDHGGDPCDSANPTSAVLNDLLVGTMSPSESGERGNSAGGVASTRTPSSTSGGGSISCEISARCSMDLLPSILPAGPGNTWEEEEEEGRSPMGAPVSQAMPAFQFTSLRAASTTPTCSGGGAGEDYIPAAPLAPTLQEVAKQLLPVTPQGESPVSQSDYWHQRLEKALHHRQLDTSPASTMSARSKEAFPPSGSRSTTRHKQLQGHNGGSVIGRKLGRMEACAVNASHLEPQASLVIASTGPILADEVPSAGSSGYSGVTHTLPPHSCEPGGGSPLPGTAWGCGATSKQRKGIFERLKSKFRNKSADVRGDRKDGPDKFKPSKPSFWSIYGINL